MPEEETIERAREDEREGKSPSTQAGEFVREEMEHIREGKHGARSPEQAIAIGLSKARRAGIKLPPPKRGKQRTKRQAKRDLTKGRAGRRKKPSPKRSRATKRALKRESRRSASRQALSRHAKRVARQRSARSRSAAAKKAARTRKRRALRCSVARGDTKDPTAQIWFVKLVQLENNKPLRSGTLRKRPKLHCERKRSRICRKRRARLSVKREPRLHERNAPDQNEISLTVCDDLITIRGGIVPHSIAWCFGPL